ncbi:MAG: hybrid sensor histidine kinase/response regulator [Flavobacteriales bacterium]
MTRSATVEEKRVRVLLIEDDEDDHILTRELLAEIPDRPYLLDRAANYATGLDMLLQGSYAICLLDYRLGARNGVELLKEARQKGDNSAIIMLTGQKDRELDLAAMEAGATDFLEKVDLNAPLLERALRYALQQKRNADLLEERVASRTAELHASEERLRRIAADLSEADRRKNEFMAILAHELRNPLAPLSTAVDVLQLNAEDSGQVRAVAEMLERQVRQMVHLVDDLLDVSRITRGKIDLRLQTIELSTVVDQAIEASNAQLLRAGHELRVFRPDRPLHVNGDPVRIAQVLGNLLSNAGKFTDPGGHIELSTRAENTLAVINVKDNGIGVAAENMSRIFDMFMQIDGSLERPTSGLGLGLTLVKNLVELHGGTVQVESAGVGKGTQFTLRLPLLEEVPGTV